MATDGFSATINFAIRIPPICFGLQYVRRQNAALKSDRFGVLLVRGFALIRHIGRNLKVALDPDANYTEDKGDFEIPVEDEPEETGEEDNAEE